MQIVDILKHYQGDRSLREYAEVLGIGVSTLSQVYGGQRNAGNVVIRAFLRVFPEAAAEITAALAAPAPDSTPAPLALVG